MTMRASVGHIPIRELAGVRAAQLEYPKSIFTELVSAAKIGSAAALLYFIAQVTTSTALPTNLLFTTAVFAGTASVVVGGGLRSVTGLLNFSLLAKYLLLSLLIKVLLREPSESHLAAPLTTPLVMCLGFCSVLGATIFVRRILNNGLPLCRPVLEARQLLVVFWIALFIGNVAWLITSFTKFGLETAEEGIYVGGLVGISRYCQILRDFAVAVAVLYAHASGSRRLLSHPLTLLAAGLSIAAAVGSGSKALLMNPLFFAGFAVFLIKGWRYIPFYLFTLFALWLLSEVIFPVVHYTRALASDQQGYELYASQFLRAVTDPNVRVEMKKNAIEYYTENHYYGTEVGIWARFAMIGNADNLIAPTEITQNFTGWLTIWWGIQMIPPRFLYKDKPIRDASQELSLITGMADLSSTGVPVAYGFMAGMFNAFGLYGAFFGCFILTVWFYGWAKLFFGNAANTNLWLIYTVGWWHHAWCEDSLSGVINGLWYAVIGYSLYQLSRIVSRSLPAKRKA